MTYGYGTVALNIYDDCCNKFGWDSSKRYLFDKQCVLYAEGATPAGYSPWFLVHSNLTDTKDGNWFNRILSDGTVEEVWTEQEVGLYTDESQRVTFTKTRNYGYVFLGIHKPTEVKEERLPDGKKCWVKIYQLVSEAYPNRG